jgi:7-cyano-7-deazaguanine reductase
MSESTYEGLQFGIDKIELPELEIWEFQYPGSNTDLRVEIPEFTCICPKTGLPDFADIVIEYQPDKYCIELKSLKLYIVAFRDIGIFHEHVVNKLLNDLAAVVKPKSMKITGVFNNRGGIVTTASASL